MGGAKVTHAETLNLIVQTDQFVKKYRQTEYYNFECLILPDGRILEATPSHLEALISVYGKPRETVWKEMPITAVPLYWLAEKTSCVPTYGLKGYLAPLPPRELTEPQRLCVEILDRRRCVANQPLRLF